MSVLRLKYMRQLIAEAKAEIDPPFIKQAAAN
jgi:hypothetical protein